MIAPHSLIPTWTFGLGPMRLCPPFGYKSMSSRGLEGEGNYHRAEGLSVESSGYLLAHLLRLAAAIPSEY